MMRVAIAARPRGAAARAARRSQISARSRSLQPGEVVVLSIVLPAASDAVRVRAFDRDVAAYPDGERTWRALVGVDLDVKPGTYPVTVDAGAGAGRMHASYDLRIAPRVFRTRRLTVNEAFVTPPPSEQARIEREAALLAGRLEGARRRAPVDAAVRPSRAAGSQQRVRHAQHLQRQAAQRARRRRLSEPGRHADPGAQCRPRRGRPQSLFLGEHRDHRSRPGTVFDARAPVGDRRARRGSRDRRPAARPASARRDASPVRTCTGPCARAARASIRCRCWHSSARRQPLRDAAHRQSPSLALRRDLARRLLMFQRRLMTCVISSLGCSVCPSR